VNLYVGKREDFGRRKEKTKLRGRGGVKIIVENLLNMFLFIARVLTTYYFLYLFIFIIL